DAFFRVGMSPTTVAVAADGRTAVVTNTGERMSGTTICVVDLYATNLVRTIPLRLDESKRRPDLEPRDFHRPTGVTFIQDQPRALVACAIEGALVLVDLIEARVVSACDLEGADSHDVVVDHSGRFAYVANRGSGTVSVVSIDRMAVVHTIEAGGGPHGMALHPTREEIWVTNLETNSISIIDCVEREERLEFACGAMPVDVAFTPDGRFALVANMQEGNVSVIETKGLRVATLVELERVSDAQARLRPVEFPGHFGRSPLPTQIVVDPEGAGAYVSTRRDDRIHRIDLSTYDVTLTLPAPVAPQCLVWSRVPDDAETARIVPVARVR
ncbi:MAG: YncE family protein, partial [Planctomycetota bacterium]